MLRLDINILMCLLVLDITLGVNAQSLSQMYQTALNFSNVGIDCFYSDCASTITGEQICGGMLRQNVTEYRRLLQSLNLCYNHNYCGANFYNTSIFNVLLPIAVSGYSGQCNLQGNAMINGGSDVNNNLLQTSSSTNSNPTYNDSLAITLRWTGLTVTCNSNPQSTSLNTLNNNYFLRAIICFINNFIPIFSAVCSTSSSTFSSGVQIQQNVNLYFRITNENQILSSSAIGVVVNSPTRITATVSFSSNSIPNNYRSAIQQSIQTLFTATDFQNVISNSYRQVYIQTLQIYFERLCYILGNN